MVSRAQKLRLTIFLSVSFIILFSAIAIITGSKLLEKKTTYYIRYTNMSLSGLEVGSAVRYRGIRVGRIEDIYIDEKDIRSIIVKITVDPEVPIKVDTEAIVTYFGITGLKIIELQGGSNESDRLKPDSFITAGMSLVDSMTDQAEVITQKLDLILNNLAEMTDVSRRNKIFRLVDNTANTLETVQTLIDTNQMNLYNSIENISRFSSGLDTLMSSSILLVEDIRTVTNSDHLLNTIANLDHISKELKEAELSNLIAKLTRAVEQTDKTFTHLDLTLLKSRHDILSSTEILRESLENFNEFTRLISENPSLLLRSSQQQEIEGR